MKNVFVFFIILTTTSLTTCSSSPGLDTRGWDGTYSQNSTIFRNTLYFKNTTPYCTAQVLAGKVKQSPYQETEFNPVPKSFILHKGGGSHFIEATLNTKRKYCTKINWYDRHENFLNTEYIGSDKEYQYLIQPEHMGKQFINLNNIHRKECWEKEKWLYINSN